MTIEILGNAEGYLCFNDANEPLCARCTGFNKPKNRAREVYITVRDDPFPTYSNGVQPLHIEVDGKYVRFGHALCGIHDRAGGGGAMGINANILHNDPLLDFDVLRRAYIQHRDGLLSRRREEEARWAKRQREIASMTEDDFVVELDGRPREMRWVIKGPGYDGKPLPTSWVSLTNESGSWFINAGDYSGHVGRGHGSPAIARIMARLMVEAADIAEEHNKEEVRCAGS